MSASRAARRNRTEGTHRRDGRRPAAPSTSNAAPPSGSRFFALAIDAIDAIDCCNSRGDFVAFAASNDGTGGNWYSWYYGGGAVNTDASDGVGAAGFAGGGGFADSGSNVVLDMTLGEQSIGGSTQTTVYDAKKGVQISSRARREPIAGFWRTVADRGPLDPATYASVRDVGHRK